MSTEPIEAQVLQQLKEVVGPRGWIEDSSEIAPYLVDERELFRGQSPLVVCPETTDQVSQLVSICARYRIGIVPHGGNTGYVGGATPSERGDEIVLSLQRLNRIRDIDALNYTMTVEAGCILAHVQEAAQRVDRLFPLSLAAEGSCQIGGNLATNAGGTAVLRYGNARDQVLGLEVVLASGEVWDGLRCLRKDNTGYDLKDLFIGAEGTLGIITAAVLKLASPPLETLTALLAVASPARALELLSTLRRASGDTLTSFEYFQRHCLDLVVDHVPPCVDPFESRFEHYVLVEIGIADLGSGLVERLEDCLATAMETGQILDAIIAANADQAQRLWQLRERIPEAQKRAGACIKHDVAVPVSKVPEFLERGLCAAIATIPGVGVAPFGHLGDGNIHFNLIQPQSMERAEFLDHSERVSRLVHDIVVDLGGSFSAEHGIGRLKLPELQHYTSCVEQQLMRTIKSALDPHGIMNPGKLVPAAESSNGHTLRQGLFQRR